MCSFPVELIALLVKSTTVAGINTQTGVDPIVVESKVHQIRSQHIQGMARVVGYSYMTSFSAWSGLPLGKVQLLFLSCRSIQSVWSASLWTLEQMSCQLPFHEPTSSRMPYTWLILQWERGWPWMHRSVRELRDYTENNTFALMGWAIMAEYLTWLILKLMQPQACRLWCEGDLISSYVSSWIQHSN